MTVCVLVLWKKKKKTQHRANSVLADADADADAGAGADPDPDPESWRAIHLAVDCTDFQLRHRKKTPFSRIPSSHQKKKKNALLLHLTSNEGFSLSHTHTLFHLIHSSCVAAAAAFNGCREWILLFGWGVFRSKEEAGMTKWIKKDDCRHGTKGHISSNGVVKERERGRKCR